MNGRLFHLKVTVYLMTTASSTRNDRWFYHEHRSYLLPLAAISTGSIMADTQYTTCRRPEDSTSTWSLVGEYARVAYGFI
jgi:hypothetical protein